MSTKFSAHPDLAVEQLQRAAELTARQNSCSSKAHAHHRRHPSSVAGHHGGTRNATKQLNSTNTTALANVEPQRPSPVRTLNISGGSSSHTPPPVDVLDNKFAYNTNTMNALVLAYIDDIDLNCGDVDGEDDVYIQNTNSRTSNRNNTKDCADYTPSTSTLRWSTTAGGVDAAVDPASAATHPTQDESTSVDEPDFLQHRFSRSAAGANCNSRLPSQQHYYTASQGASPLHTISDGCASGLSSALSSPSASTVSSPLSTPTRLAPHYQQNQKQQPNSSNCCQKSLSTGCCGAPSDTCCNQEHHQHKHQHHQHHHHHPHHQHKPMAATSSSSSSSTSKAVAAAAAAAASSSSSSGCKKSQKYDPRLLGPSRYRQLLPVVLCILSFATVFSILIVYMDTTEIRHKQFRLNMSRDYEFFGVAQDDPTLIAFLREIHMRKYPMHFLKNAPIDVTTTSTTSTTAHHTNPTAAAAAAAAAVASTSSTSATAMSTHFNFSTHYEGLTAEMGHYVSDLVGGKENGAFIQSLPGAMGHLMTAPWLAATLNWVGLVVEPEPRRFFTLRKQNAQRPGLQLVHACISPNPYPKEVTIHNEESEVRINSLLDEETSWFNSRVKCFPLYSLMLACNRVAYDLLSLGVHGHELEILQTLPFDRVQIEVISIHLTDDIARGYLQELTKFLADKSYKLQKTFGRNYFYHRSKTISRTRKKDILLLKTP